MALKLAASPIVLADDDVAEALKLTSPRDVVQLIGYTTTRTGLSVRAEIDSRPYATGVKVTDAELAAVQLEPAAFHGAWNYTISPRT